MRLMHLMDIRRRGERSSQCSRATDSGAASLLSGVPRPASPGPARTSAKRSATPHDYAIQIDDVVELFY